MLVQFVNNWMKSYSDSKIALGLWPRPIWLSSEFFSSNYLQIGQHVVLLQIQILIPDYCISKYCSVIYGLDQQVFVVCLSPVGYGV